MAEDKTKPASQDSYILNLSCRDQRYAKFYQIVDKLVDELQNVVCPKRGKPKRKVKGNELIKLHYSVECLLRDCLAS